MKLHEKACGGQGKALYRSFSTTVAHVQLQVLGLIGKLTGPWMKRFYTSSNAEIDHVEAITIVKNVVALLKMLLQWIC